MNNALRLEEIQNGPVSVVSVTGRIDSTNASEFLEGLQKALTRGDKAVVVDLKGVLYLTSAAFRVLLVATDEAERKSARLVLCSVLGQVRELFEMGGLLDAFTIHNSREDALAALN